MHSQFIQQICLKSGGKTCLTLSIPLTVVDMKNLFIPLETCYPIIIVKTLDLLTTEGVSDAA